MIKTWNALVELCAILVDATLAAWDAADLVARLREWRYCCITHADLVDAPAPARGAYSPLSSRQERVLHVAHQQGRVTNAVARAVCPLVTPETVRLDLAALVTRGLLERHGQNKGMFYKPPAYRRQ